MFARRVCLERATAKWQDGALIFSYLAGMAILVERMSASETFTVPPQFIELRKKIQRGRYGGVPSRTRADTSTCGSTRTIFRTVLSASLIPATYPMSQHGFSSALGAC
jgi:hypothetical protein